MKAVFGGLFAVAATLLLSGNAIAQQGVEMEIDRATCLELMKRPAVPSATYTPGVDAYGRAVTPAEGDGGGNPAWLSESITIVLSVDLAERYGIGNNGANFGADAALGQVTMRNGRIYVNGKPLMGRDEESMRAACRSMGING